MFQTLRQKKQVQNEGRGARTYQAFSYPLDISRPKGKVSILSYCSHFVPAITPERTAIVKMIITHAGKDTESKEFTDTVGRDVHTYYGKQCGGILTKRKEEDRRIQ